MLVSLEKKLISPYFWAHTFHLRWQKILRQQPVTYLFYILGDPPACLVEGYGMG